MSERQRFNGDLPFGVMTSCMPFLGLEQVLNLISRIGGVQEVELSAVDSGGLRAQDKADHVASHLPVYDFIATPRDTALRFAEQFNKRELGVTLGNYDRIHSGNREQDHRVLEYMLRVIDFASALGGKDGGAHGVDVAMFWGWDRRAGIQANLDDVVDKVTILARYAVDRNVIITTENCHMPGGWPDADESYLPQQVMRSAGSTLAGRLYIAQKLKEKGVENVAFTWDPSHPETEGANPLVEALLAYEKERITQTHLKGHNHNIHTERIRKAYFGGPAMAGWAVPEGERNAFYKVLRKLGVPVGDNMWAQQYGAVTLPGNAECITPVPELVEIARVHGFSGRMTAENETAEKNLAVASRNEGIIIDMYANCRAYMAPLLWKDGSSYQGKPFAPLNVEKSGRFEKQLSFREAAETYSGN